MSRTSTMVFVLVLAVLLAGCQQLRLGKLHRAAERGDSTAILALLDRGAAIDGVDGEGNTPDRLWRHPSNAEEFYIVFASIFRWLVYLMRQFLHCAQRVEIIRRAAPAMPVQNRPSSISPMAKIIPASLCLALLSLLLPCPGPTSAEAPTVSAGVATHSRRYGTAYCGGDIPLTHTLDFSMLCSCSRTSGLACATWTHGLESASARFGLCRELRGEEAARWQSSVRRRSSSRVTTSS